MKSRRISTLGFAFLLLLFVEFDFKANGDDHQSATAAPASKTDDSSSVDVKGAAAQASTDAELAILEGQVTFQGKLPPLREIVATKDVEFCSQHVKSRPEFVVSESRGLSEVVIEIRGVKEPEAGWSWKHPEDGYTVRQRGCGFEPYLLVMPDQQELTIYNDDPVAHNINTGQWNLLQAAGAEPLKQNLRGRRPVRVSCNIHSWMESWIYLTQSPYFAVSTEEGKFRIEGIPPGRYRVTVWHPNLRALRESVELKPGRTAKQDFEFQSPYKG